MFGLPVYRFSLFEFLNENHQQVKTGLILETFGNARGGPSEKMHLARDERLVNRKHFGGLYQKKNPWEVALNAIRYGVIRSGKKRASACKCIGQQRRRYPQVHFQRRTVKRPYNRKPIGARHSKLRKRRSFRQILARICIPTVARLDRHSAQVNRSGPTSRAHQQSMQQSRCPIVEAPVLSAS